MKKSSFVISGCLAVLLFGFQAASAQIRINIPKIPKIKKEKPQPQTDSSTTTTSSPSGGSPTTSNGQNTETRTNDDNQSKPTDKCSPNGWLMVHTEEIAKRQEEVDSFTPDRGWLVGTSTYNYLLFAVSPSMREDWLKSSNALDYKDCVGPALDRLAVSAAKKLPTYLPDTKKYGFHNLAEEKLMKGKINDLANHKIFYTGIKQASWLIDKNDFGIPTARYKHGMVWVRYMPNDHPYCRIYYINLIQDYAGGGTYGATYARYVDEELSGCPVGK